MEDKLVFVIGPPRSGSTMLQRMLGSHPDIYTRPEPHIVTPLAHLGYFANVERAPYDHINAAEAIREYVEELPGGEEDYLNACRAYTNELYGKMLAKSGRRIFVDKTPAYALVLPFLARLYPRAKYIVLTRHPLAVLSSYANSFFEGDYQAAQEFNDILGRYVPAMAAFIRRKKTPCFHVRYEDLVSEPRTRLAGIFAYLDLPDEPGAVNYGAQRHTQGSYGDPKVKHRDRPDGQSLHNWAADLAADARKLEIARRAIEPLDPEDIAAWGYDKASLFDPVGLAAARPQRPNPAWTLDSYRLKRKVFLALRSRLNDNRLKGALRRVRYYCDVLLRD
ncbi:MAG TPA: sulfotransferase [Myxococcota bacterium]|nr:sulfotransferase [Myxococcota bacterium]